MAALTRSQTPPERLQKRPRPRPLPATLTHVHAGTGREISQLLIGEASCSCCAQETTTWLSGAARSTINFSPALRIARVGSGWTSQAAEAVGLMLLV